MEMPELLDENIFDILSMLPVKSLMRFKCVSKPWCSLISDPKFIKAHLFRLDQMSGKILLSTRPRASIMDYEDCENSIVELNYPFTVQETHTQVQLVGSCNGLVCLFQWGFAFVIWNPFTREFRNLPPLTPSDVIDIFHPWRVSYFYFSGFGYDSSIDDYKVIVGFSSIDSFNNNCSPYCEVQVFALKSNKWKSIGFDNVGYYFKGHSNLLNGNFHWLSLNRKPLDEQPVILSFNIKEEQFTEVAVPLPAEASSYDEDCHLYCFENSLFLTSKCGDADADADDAAKDFDVWEKNMDDGVDSFWKRIYRFRPSSWTHQLLFTRNHKLAVSQYVTMLRTYDLEAMSRREFQVNCSERFKGIVYLETLVSPN